MAVSSQNDNAATLVKIATLKGSPANVNALGTITTAQTIALPAPATAPNSTVTLSTSSTTAFTLPAPAAGASIVLEIIQDGSGSRLASFATSSGTLAWAGSAAPTLSTTASHADVIAFDCYDGVQWIGRVQAANVH